MTVRRNRTSPQGNEGNSMIEFVHLVKTGNLVGFYKVFILWIGETCSACLQCPIQKKQSGVEHQVRVSTLIKKKTKFFLIYKEVQKEVVAKSSMTNGLRIYN